MRLEWFRKHQKFVYYILVPASVLGLASFGVGGRATSIFGGGGGPSVSFTVGNRTEVMTASEVIHRRQILRSYERVGNVSTDEAARHVISVRSAQHAGFDVGNVELRDRLVEDVKSKVRTWDRTENPVANDIVYEKLLTKLELTSSQFESLSQEMGVQQKYFNFIISQTKANDVDLFVKYCRDKETVRLRYKTIASYAYLGNTTQPTVDKMKAFYEANKTKIQELKDVMFTQPKMSADVLYFDPTKMLAELKPTDEELKRFYENFRALHKEWQVPAAPGGKEVVPGQETYKPLEEVKAEVEKKWREDEKSQRPKARLDSLKEELDKAEKAWQDEQKGKPEAKPFDVANWAKEHGLIFWSTPEQTEYAYKSGKDEANSPAFKAVSGLFDQKQSTERMEKMGYMTHDQVKQRIDDLMKFGYTQSVEYSAPEKGVFSVRMKKFVGEEPMKFEDAQVAIGFRMRLIESVELASKDAEKLRSDWNEGKVKPDLYSLDEIVSDSQNQKRNPLVGRFFGSPKPVGEVLPVAQGAAHESSNPFEENTDPGKVFYVGFAVERKLPTWKTFHDDVAWDREQSRTGILQSDENYIGEALTAEIKQMGKRTGDQKDPALNDEVRRGHPVDD